MGESGGGVVNETGTEIPPGALGVDALGSETLLAGVELDETLKPRTVGSAAAGPASKASAAAATTRKRISLPLGRGGAVEPRAREPALPSAPPEGATPLLCVPP